MKDRRLGGTGLKVSEICLGTMTFGNQCDEETSFSILDTAEAAGIYFFDLSDVYPTPNTPETVGRTETIFGHWLERRGRREDLVIATKCYGRMGTAPNDAGLSRKHVMSAIDASLERLGTDYVDLYQVHHSDPDTPVEETLDALSDVVRQGKARYLGCSNYEAWELAEAALAAERHGLKAYQCIQPRYNLLYRAPERDLLPFCQAEGIGVIPYNAQAGGFLSGKYQRGQEPPEGTRFHDRMGQSATRYRGRYWHDVMFDALGEVLGVAKDVGCTGGQLGIAWLLAQPGVTAPIVGATSVAQLTESLKGVNVTLDSETLARLDATTKEFV